MHYRYSLNMTSQLITLIEMIAYDSDTSGPSLLLFWSSLRNYLNVKITTI